MPTDYSTVVDKQIVNRFSYPVIKLWHYVEATRQGNYPELTPLLPALTKQPDELLLADMREVILQETNAQKRADLLSIAVTISRRYFIKISYGDFFKRRLSK